jgi:hypothetical protein
VEGRWPPGRAAIYEKGNHGFGMTPKGLPVDHWIEQFGDWLGQRDLIKAETPALAMSSQPGP